MSKQPEALRLADALTTAVGQVDAEDDVIHVARWYVECAAAELRRLHEENGRLRIVAEVSTLLWDQRSALLEALRHIANHDLSGADLIICGHIAHALVDKARAAVKAVESPT